MVLLLGGGEMMRHLSGFTQNKQVFSGGDGIIYALMDNGDLLWYRHDGRTDGTLYMGV